MTTRTTTKKSTTKHRKIANKKKFTVQSIIDYLIKKYPDYIHYVEKVKTFIKSDVIISNLREADHHITMICKKMQLGIFQTIIVREAVKSTLAEHGLPK